MTQPEILLEDVPSESGESRLAIFLLPPKAGESSKVAICQQNWADGIGWFTQSRVEVEPAQLASLRQFLAHRAPTSARPRPDRPSQGHQLRIVG